MVDVKTHREDTKFNMPNLVSVERLTRFYESDSNVFSLIFIRYRIEKTKVIVSEVLFSPISELGMPYYRRLGLGADSNSELK